MALTAALSVTSHSCDLISPPNSRDAIERLLHRLAALVDGEDLGALLREQHGGGAAVAPARADAAGAGDQRHLVLQAVRPWRGPSCDYCEPASPSFFTSVLHFSVSDLM